MFSATATWWAEAAVLRHCLFLVDCVVTVSLQVSDYWLNRRIKAQSEAFMRGLRDLVRPEWIRAFSPLELQVRPRTRPSRTPELPASSVLTGFPGIHRACMH